MMYIAMDAKSQNSRVWVKNYLDEHKYEYEDIGAQSSDDTLDITDFIPKIAEKVKQENATAITACGNGIGISIGMNRYRGVRAALVTQPTFAEWGRVYDDCNVLCLAEWSMSSNDEVVAILDAWFGTKFEPIPRRIGRIQKLDTLGL